MLYQNIIVCSTLICIVRNYNVCLTTRRNTATFHPYIHPSMCPMFRYDWPRHDSGLRYWNRTLILHWAWCGTSDATVDALGAIHIETTLSFWIAVSVVILFCDIICFHYKASVITLQTYKHVSGARVRIVICPTTVPYNTRVCGFRHSGIHLHQFRLSCSING